MENLAKLFQMLTDVIVDRVITNPLLGDLVEDLHKSLSVELTTAYMLEHGYEVLDNGKFVEKTEVKK